MAGICELQTPGPVLVSNICEVVGCRYTQLQEQVTKQTYQVAAVQKALQRTQDEVITDSHSRSCCESVHAHKRFCFHGCGHILLLPTCLPVYLPACKLSNTVSATVDYLGRELGNTVSFTVR